MYVAKIIGTNVEVRAYRMYDAYVIICRLNKENKRISMKYVGSLRGKRPMIRIA